MTYLFDLTPSVNLYDLADQFDVLGFKGWDLCLTEDDKRNLLKAAAELHRYIGTPYALKRAFKALGFYDIEVEQHVPFLYNDTFAYDGSQTYGDSDWANFKIVVDVGNIRGVSPTQAAISKALAEAWAPVYCTCVAVEFRATLTDRYPEISDTIDGMGTMEFLFDDFAVNGFLYNDTAYYDDTYYHDTSGDEVTP